nr:MULTISPECIES: hypothetical protein [Acidipropionibacterium]BAB17916.1 unnamed protein product [Acidipropionibacterium acidipropionici]
MDSDPVMALDEDASALRACPHCGAPVEAHGGRGRPRVWCSDDCRKRASEERRAAQAEARPVRTVTVTRHLEQGERERLEARITVLEERLERARQLHRQDVKFRRIHYGSLMYNDDFAAARRISPADPEYGLDLPDQPPIEPAEASTPTPVPPRSEPAPTPVFEHDVFSGLGQVRPAPQLSGNRAQRRAAARHAKRRH